MHYGAILLFCVGTLVGGTVDILPYSLLIGNSLYKPDRHDHKPELVLDGGPNYYYYYYATTCVCQNASRMISDALHLHEKLYKNGKSFLCAYLKFEFFTLQMIIGNSRFHSDIGLRIIFPYC